MKIRDRQIANLAKARAARSDGEPTKKREPTPLKSIRLHCLMCSGDSAKTVKYCTLDGLNSEPACPLWLFRFGKRPKSARKKYGDKFLDPSLMPGGDVAIEDLP